MNIAQISDNLEKLVESFNKESFIFDLLLAYGTPKSTIARLQHSDAFAENQAITELVIKKKLAFRVVNDVETRHAASLLMNQLKADEKLSKQSPRFIVVTDFETLLAYDTKTAEALDIPILDLPQHNDFFLPWAGMEKSKQQTENIADVRAAERMAKLYDEIRKDNPTQTTEEVHNLNVFLSRLLFCYFAEDTGIFDKDLFTKSVDSHTQTDGSDLNGYLDTLFAVMNTPTSARAVETRLIASLQKIPAYLNAFPYVNGGLFRNPHTAPIFTRRSRQMLVDCGLSLQWQDINPDIFGSMIQAVITPEHRGGLGMHYTSVPNIMKVIEPLFLTELYEEFTKIVETRHASSAYSDKSKHAFNILLKRLWKIKIFDPACGSGNFLIIAYKELRKLEMLIFKELGTFAFSEINLGNFYGIELDDFAHEVATLSLWLAEHQMNQAFMREFGRAKPALPLQETGNIVQGNACRIDWETVCPKNEGDEIYILGNPPYLGSRRQDEVQKEDLKLIFNDEFKSIDYIAAWFLKGSNFIKEKNSKCAFVSTNSICQGEQVSMIWKKVLNENVEIAFAHKDFKWSNNAKSNAAVIVIIVGLQNKSNNKKFIFHNGFRTCVNDVNPYLVNGKTIYVTSRQKPISNFPEMNFGNMPADGGKLLFTSEEKDEFNSSEPKSYVYFKKILSAHEFINGKERWCLWLEDYYLDKQNSLPLIDKRISELKAIRVNSSRPQLAAIPHLFAQITQPKNKDFILIPRHSSENREYIPIGYFSSEFIAHDSCLIVPTEEIYLFNLLTSKIHMIWVNSVAGRIKTDIRYSKDIVYNNFPFPPISDKQKKELEQHVYNILGEREKHSEKTLAQLYDPDKMPEGLREAHRQNDLAVERCYRSRPFESDEERLEYLFKLYEQMIKES